MAPGGQGSVVGWKNSHIRESNRINYRDIPHFLRLEYILLTIVHSRSITENIQNITKYSILFSLL